jgi:RHS repeat-associated protein
MPSSSRSTAATGFRSRFRVSRVALTGLLTVAMVVTLTGTAHAVVQAGLPAASGGVGMTGARPSATRVSFFAGDQVNVTVDVGTGNLMVSTQNLVLRGVNGNVPIGQTYNLLGSTVGSTSTPVANKWTLGLAAAGSLAQGPTGVVFTGGDGSTWLFTPVAGSSTAFTAPAGLKADLVKTGTGYTLTYRESRTLVTFDTDGNAVSAADRNGNATTIGYTAGQPSAVTSSAGPTAGRTASLSYSSTTRTLTVSQVSGSLSRSVKYVKDAASNLTSIVDANGKTTSFTYGSGSKLASITSPTGAVTRFTYGSSDGVLAQVDQLNTTAGSPGTSTTRFQFGSAQTLVAGPNAASGDIGSVPHTTYTLNSGYLVTAVTDPMGRSRSRTYTPNNDVATATDGTGTTAGTTTATYGANGGQSLTRVQAPGGASGTAAYANTAPASKYLPSSTTDDAGNNSLYTYNGAGNALTASDASAATATLTYNTDGTVASALAPGNGTNKTLYGYNTNHQVTSMTPVTGTSLTARTFTYDGFGRVATATDGRGVTVTYSYDLVDRLTGTSFSDNTATVTSTYNEAGQPRTRVDGSGTTTYGYDQLGRLMSRGNTAGGGTIGYGYDKASNLVSTTDTRGMTTYAFDAANAATSLTYQYNGGPHVLMFATDDRGRRTDAWLDANPTHTTWAARTHTDYDSTGRVAGVSAWDGTGDTDNHIILDLDYCYAAGSTAPTCSTAASADRSKLRWVTDTLTGAVTTYSYDTSGRLTQAVVTGGPAPTTYTYTYDSRGNRLTAAGGSTPAQTLSVNAANQITTAGYTYDGAGNLTADPDGTYTYNGARQLTGITVGGTTRTLGYAGTGQNEILHQPTTKGNYEYTYGRTDQNGQPIIEQVEWNNQTAYVEHDPVTGEPLMLRTSTGMQSLYVYDGTGNPAILVTNASYRAFAYSYDPYGTPTLTVDSGGNGTVQNPYTFKNGVQERTTGWIRYGARWYDPSTGRFTQQDTLDAPLDPHNANRYAYAADDPINLSDPTGLVCAYDVAAAGAGIVAAGLGIGATVATGTIAGAPAGAVLGLGAGSAALLSGVYSLEGALFC